MWDEKCSTLYYTLRSVGCSQLENVDSCMFLCSIGAARCFRFSFPSTVRIHYRTPSLQGAPSLFLPRPLARRSKCTLSRCYLGAERTICVHWPGLYYQKTRCTLILSPVRCNLSRSRFLRRAFRRSYSTFLPSFPHQETSRGRPERLKNCLRGSSAGTARNWNVSA